ncbi:hypothetical protein [Burkholderia ubonensis]|uniref:hypothetical protein n=1 Tax=Burkholderia ubonensis TaxID=101571 RepID=UPI0012F873D3|nr:hypothetical protein [Burkholderia ubonensis]
MKNFALMVVLFISFAFRVDAESIIRDSGDFNNNVFLLSSRCGYEMGESVFGEVLKSESTMNDKIILLDFYVSMPLEDRLIQGKLSFGCIAAGSDVSKQKEAGRLTASEEIARADSGGRYSRNVVWQRKYEGDGWSGTIAYVNSVFGDQENLSVPDYFMICPDKGRLACFSFEVLGVRLDRRESDKIPVLLNGVGAVE